MDFLREAAQQKSKEEPAKPSKDKVESKYLCHEFFGVARVNVILLRTRTKKYFWSVNTTRTEEERRET